MANKLVRDFTVRPATATFRLGYDPTAYPHAPCNKNLDKQWKKFLNIPPTPRKQKQVGASPKVRAAQRATTARPSTKERRQAKLEAMLLKEQKKDDAMALMLLREIEALEEMKAKAEQKYSTLDARLRPKTASIEPYRSVTTKDDTAPQARVAAMSQGPSRCSTAY